MNLQYWFWAALLFMCEVNMSRIANRKEMKKLKSTRRGKKGDKTVSFERHLQVWHRLVTNILLQFLAAMNLQSLLPTHNTNRNYYLIGRALDLHPLVTMHILYILTYCTYSIQSRSSLYRWYIAVSKKLSTLCYNNADGEEEFYCDWEIQWFIPSPQRPQLLEGKAEQVSIYLIVPFCQSVTISHSKWILSVLPSVPHFIFLWWTWSPC